MDDSPLAKKYVPVNPLA